MPITFTPPSAVLPRKGPPTPPVMQAKTAPVPRRAAGMPTSPPPRPPAAAPMARIIQRCGIQDLSVYTFESERVRNALAEIQSVLSNPARIRYWVGWLERQTQEIAGRLRTLDPESDKWISVYSDAPRSEPQGQAMQRWRTKPNKALDVALWRIERRWMVGMMRHTLTEDTGSSAEAFSNVADRVGALKDVGAPLQHGEYPHRIQWYVIYRHLLDKGYTPQDVYAAYKETLKGKHTRVLLNKKLYKMDDEAALGHDPKNQRSLWDRVVDIRLSERAPELEKAFWASPLAVTASFTPLKQSPLIPDQERPVRPKTNLPEVEDFSNTMVGNAVYQRLLKRKKQSAADARYSPQAPVPVSAWQRSQLNLGRELANRSLAERLNLY